MKYRKKASVALMSVLILSAFSLILVTAMVQIGISSGLTQNNQTINKIIVYAADSCLNEGILRLESDSTYTGSTITFDSDTSCSVSVTTPTSGERDLSITSSYDIHSHSFTANVNITTGTHQSTVTLNSFTIQ